MNHADAVIPALAHAAADMDAGVAHMFQRIESILISARGDDLAIEFRRGIVVVVIKAGLFSRFA